MFQGLRPRGVIGLATKPLGFSSLGSLCEVLPLRKVPWAVGAEDGDASEIAGRLLNTVITACEKQTSLHPVLSNLRLQIRAFASKGFRRQEGSGQLLNRGHLAVL